MAEVKISVLLNDNLIQANGLSRFTFIPSGRPYLMYTLNEKSVQNGEELNKVYVSEEGDKTTQFQPINQDDWTNLKNIMVQLGVPQASIPNNIQLSQLNEQQYVVGPYKKIAIKDAVMEAILANQVANEPKEEQIAQPTGKTQFFDPSLNEAAVEESTPETVEVPNAFGMSAPVPEEMAPISLVDQSQPAQEQAAPVAQAVEPAPAPAQAVPQAAPAAVEPVAPAADASTQLVQPAQAVGETNNAGQVVQEAVPAELVQPAAAQPIVETTAIVQNVNDDLSIVKQALKTVLDYCQGDMNKLNELLKDEGLTVVVQPVNGVETTTTQATTEEVKEEYPDPVTSIIDINNLPVVNQEAPAEENVLNEESFEPTAPSLPVDSMEAQNLVNSTPDGVIPGGLPQNDNLQATNTETAVAQAPVPAVADVSTQLVQPAEVAPSNVVPFPAAPVAQVENPVPVATVPNNIVQFPSDSNLEPVVPDTTVADANVEPASMAPTVAEASTQLVQPVEAVPGNVVSFPTPAAVEPAASVADANTQLVQPVEAAPSNVVPFPAAAPVEPAALAAEASIQLVQPVEAAPSNVVPFPAAAPVEPVAPAADASTQLIQPAQAVGETNNAGQVVQEAAPQELVQPADSMNTINQGAVAQTTIIDAAPVTNNQSVVDVINNSEVNYEIPDQNVTLTKIDNDLINNANPGMPTITPVTAEDMAPKNQNTETVDTPSDEIDTSQFLDAGPVIIPAGQEAVSTQGLPGDSGVKVLEKVA